MSIMENGEEEKKDLIGYLSNRLKEKNMKIVFGLEAQGHIPTIEKILKKWNTPRPGIEPVDMTYDRYVWEEIGREIGWEPFGASLAYFELLNKKSKL